MTYVMRGEEFFKEEQFPFFIDCYTIGKGEKISDHAHEFIELVFVLSGSATHEAGGNRYQLAPGDVFVLEPGTFHHFDGSETEDTLVYNVLFDVGLLRQELDGLLQMPAFVDFFYLAPFLRKSASFIPYNPLRDSQRVQIEQNLRHIHQEFKERKEGYQLMIKTRWIESLLLLGRFHQANRTAPQQTISDDEWMKSIRHFIQQHYRQQLTLEQLCRVCGMSVSSFTAKFKKTAGTSLIDYKHKLQIEQACRLLSSSDNKILDISMEVGFNDISFFNKVFRKHTGMTPKEYRRSATTGH